MSNISESFLQWIMARAPELTSPAPNPAPNITPLPAPPPLEDSQEEIPSITLQDDPVELAEIFTIIDYQDAKGQKSRRRITFRSLKPGPVAPILRAVCHERSDIRDFRCDRIECFIEPDGEVIGTARFLKDILGFELDQAQPAKPPKPPTEAGYIREILHAPLSILILAAWSDDELHHEEMECILEYSEHEIEALQKLGILPDTVSIETVTSLATLIEKMRPQKSSVRGYVDKLRMADEDTQMRFEIALNKVIAADGKVCLSEELFVSDIAPPH